MATSQTNTLDSGHRERLRQRFIKVGLIGFSPHEVLELVLTLAIPRKDVKERAKELIARFGSLRGVLDASENDLRSVPGISDASITALRVIKGVATLYLQQTAEKSESFTEPDILYNFWRMRIGSLKNEVFEVGYLDSGHRLLSDGIETLEEGTVDRAAVYPRKVVESALRRRAAALVLAHNHPNGNPQPSDQDKILTRAIVLAAETVQISVLDHLIVTSDSILSFRKEGLI